MLSYSDVSPGMQLSGTLLSVNEPAGLLVSVAPHVRALVPVLHLPDASSAQKARSKFKVSAQRARVAERVVEAAAGVAGSLGPVLLTRWVPYAPPRGYHSPRQAASTSLPLL